jgi:DNA-binding MarR family transcriptional regulator
MTVPLLAPRTFGQTSHIRHPCASRKASRTEAHERLQASAGPAAVAPRGEFGQSPAGCAQAAGNGRGETFVAMANRGLTQDDLEAAAPGQDAPLKLEEFLPYQLNVVASLVSQALSRVYAERYDIGVPEWRVLVTLGQYGVMTGKAIGTHTHMHKTKVSRAVALLEKRRLLVRRANRADMRESFLSLTAAGRAMYENLAPHALDFARRLTDMLEPGERAAFHRALKQLTERSAKLVAEVAQQRRGDETGRSHPMEDT